MHSLDEQIHSELEAKKAYLALNAYMLALSLAVDVSMKGDDQVIMITRIILSLLFFLACFALPKSTFSQDIREIVAYDFFFVFIVYGSYMWIDGREPYNTLRIILPVIQTSLLLMMVVRICWKPKVENWPAFGVLRFFFSPISAPMGNNAKRAYFAIAFCVLAAILIRLTSIKNTHLILIGAGVCFVIFAARNSITDFSQLKVRFHHIEEAKVTAQAQADEQARLKAAAENSAAEIRQLALLAVHAADVSAKDLASQSEARAAALDAESRHLRDTLAQTSAASAQWQQECEQLRVQLAQQSALLYGLKQESAQAQAGQNLPPRIVAALAVWQFATRYMEQHPATKLYEARAAADRWLSKHAEQFGLLKPDGELSDRAHAEVLRMVFAE
ncbi:hypothetical protein V8J88_17020 [Massilia sp. W12]|uniref:hypothetical protein n=1 Tax=Massilia sp. W12 TaxID=3126507 RepID=UPI0030D028F6